ncbi:hypothetical protein L1286_20880 [Pseudoalteromonas sp. SMS1]|nr:hypothetical protein [Pseudoalteromonas sp. SMS1]MCF2859943.1 hypothetical protein [Pseudoalteromonas sp. SMS1]
MNVFFRDFFTDPVLYLSFGILGIVIALCIYYVYYFVKKVNEAEIPE